MDNCQFLYVFFSFIVILCLISVSNCIIIDYIIVILLLDIDFWR